MSEKPEFDAREAFGVDWELPGPYQDALRLFKDISQEMGVRFAVVGSLSVAIYSNKEWDPLEKNPISDIDLLLLGDEDQREDMVEVFSIERLELIERGLPRIHFNLPMHEVLGFKDGSPILKDSFGGELPIAEELVQVFLVQTSGVKVPVFHPAVNLELIIASVGSRPLLPNEGRKIRVSKERLRKVIKENPLGFPEFSQEMLKDFNYYVEHRCLRGSG